MIEIAPYGLDDDLIEAVTTDGLPRARIGRCSGLVYYATTLLVDPDIGLVERYLKHPPREPEYRAGRSHTDFMGSLRGHLGAHEVDSFLARLTKELRTAELFVGPGLPIVCVPDSHRLSAGRTQII